MAYTPPSASLADFQFTGKAYAAPSGDAVNLHFAEPTGAVLAAVPLTAHFFCSIEVAPVIAFVRTQLPLFGAFDSVAHRCGVVSAVIETSGQFPGVGHAEGEIQAALPLAGSISSKTINVGFVNGSIELSASFDSIIPPDASIRCTLPLACGLQVELKPIGALRSAIKLHGLMSCPQGYSARLAAPIKLSGHLFGVAGRVLRLSGALRVSGSFIAKAGIGGTLSSPICLTGLLQGGHLSVVESTLHGGINLSGCLFASRVDPNPIPDEVVSVFLGTDRIEVFTDA